MEGRGHWQREMPDVRDEVFQQEVLVADQPNAAEIQGEAHKTDGLHITSAEAEFLRLGDDGLAAVAFNRPASEYLLRLHHNFQPAATIRPQFQLARDLLGKLQVESERQPFANP